MARCRASIMLLSDSGEGKTYQIGELAKWWFRKTGGMFDPKTGALVPGKGEKTTLYSADLGGWATIKPIIDIGIVQLVDLTVIPDPFVWLEHIAHNRVPVLMGGARTWQPAQPQFTHNAYDSMTSMAANMMLDLANLGAKGTNIGGGASYKFTQGAGADLVTVSSNNPTHYNIVQNRILKAIAESQQATEGLVTWSARIRRAEEEGMMPVLGPQIAGKAMTPELPGWFTYTLRLGQEVMLGLPTKHVLYFEDHVDRTAPGAKVLANGRIPAGIKTQIPPKQDPANVPALLDLIAKAHLESMEQLKKDLSTPYTGPTLDLGSF